MPRYIIERKMDDMSEEALERASQASLQALEEMKDRGIVWIKSYVSSAEGKIYCEYEAPDPELIREHARRAGLPADSISEVAFEVSPEMFR